MHTHQDFSRHWALDPEVTFLNHGSFGACPVAVLAAQRRLRDQMEAEPVRFFVREYPELLERALTAVAKFLHADPQNLAFVPNATAGVNAVLRSLPFRSGDEIVVTDQEYNACRNAVDAVAETSGAKVVVAHLPFPVASADLIVEAVLAAVTPRTKLVLIDHITSQTGMILPIDVLAPALKARGVDTLVDGAHAPGMIALDLERLGATYWTGNCHKWLCAPKGAAVLWVREDKRPLIHPAVISHGRNTPVTAARGRFRHEFDWVGTDDPTAWLCVPEAIEYMGSLLHGGWLELMQKNRALVLAGRRLLCTALGVAEPTPAGMIGSMAAIPIADGPSAEPMSPFATDPLQDRLFDEHRIEVPIQQWPAAPKRLVRVSAQLYNRIEHYERLAEVLPREMRG